MAWAERDGRVEAIAPGSNSTLQLTLDRALLNPGSVGQPRDGSPDASYAVLDFNDNTWEHRRVRYPLNRI